MDGLIEDTTPFRVKERLVQAPPRERRASLRLSSTEVCDNKTSKSFILVQGKAAGVWMLCIQEY